MPPPRDPFSDPSFAPPSGPPPPAYSMQSSSSSSSTPYPPPGSQQQQQSAYPPPHQGHGGGGGGYPSPGAGDGAVQPLNLAAGVARRASREDQLAVLRRYDTVLLIDDSASMVPYWEEVRQSLEGLVDRVIQYDQDGIDIYFLNSPQFLQSVNSKQAVVGLFDSVRPVGASTPTEVRVEEILGPYIDAVELAKREGRAPVKSLNLIVITDGAADDPDTLNYAIAGFAERLDQAHAPLTQLGIQFIQVGTDPEASSFLQSLDDELRTVHNLKRDIVDTTLYPSDGSRVTTDWIVKSLLGGVNKRVDRTG